MKKYSIKSSVISFIIKKRINEIYKSSHQPLLYQKNILKNLVSKAVNTCFGYEHNFYKINDYSIFKNNIPIRNYEQIYPYIEKTIKGEKNILWPGKVKWFAKSSGTTNDKSKYIPVTSDSLYNSYIKGGKDMLSLYENNFPNNDIYNGKGLMLGGSFSQKNHVITGDISAILLSQFPYWVNYHRLPKKETALMKNWEKKIKLIVEETVNENITNITGVPSWISLILKNILKKTGKKNIKQVWPNLELYIHGGVNFLPYKNVFQELIGEEINYMEGYNASEGFFAIQDQFKSSELLLMLNYGIFYEFILLKEYQKGSKKTIWLKDVSIKKEYVMIITTNAGLWRYMIGDVIIFTSLNPYRIKIQGRTKNSINVFGEELMINNTDKALTKTCDKLNCKINEYTVAPIFINKESGGHEWVIEFKKEPNNLKEFIKELDYNLKKLNSDYEAKRTHDLIIKEPKITIVRNNQFYKWLKKKNKLGGQNKMPRLSETRKIVEEILRI